MIYENSRGGSVKSSTRKDEEKAPVMDERSGTDSSRKVQQKARTFGTKRGQKIVVRDGRLEVVAA